MGPLIASALNSAASGLGKGLGDAIGGGESGPSLNTSSGAYDNSGFSVATGGSSVKAAAEKTSTESTLNGISQNTLIVGALGLIGLLLITKIKKR